MSDPFVKLYATLLESSLWWGEDEHTRLVWITLLVAADHEGIYLGTLPGLAGKARVSLEQARHAVWRLQQPDEESRTRDHDGRRIDVIEGVGFKLLNYQKYRDKRSPKQIMDAVYKARQRERSRSADVPDMSNGSGEASLISDLGSQISDLGSDPERAREPRPAPLVAKTYELPDGPPPQSYLDEAVMRGVSPEQAVSTWEHYRGAGLPVTGVQRLDDWLCKRAKERATRTAKTDKTAAKTYIQQQLEKK